jgi:hypothetical protein
MEGLLQAYSVQRWCSIICYWWLFLQFLLLTRSTGKEATFLRLYIGYQLRKLSPYTGSVKGSTHHPWMTRGASFPWMPHPVAWNKFSAVYLILIVGNINLRLFIGQYLLHNKDKSSCSPFTSFKCSWHSLNMSIIQGVPGGKDLTSGECCLGQNIPI